MHAKIAERVKLIAEDQGHGAGWLARQAVEALAEAVEEDADPLEAGRALAGARPAMGAVAGAVGRALAAGRTTEQLVEQCRALIERRDRAAHSIAALLRPDLENRTVMTHSASATVREAVLHGTPSRVVCTITEPHEEGRTLADELSAEGVIVDLVADGDARHAVGTVDVFLVGADSVFRDGSLVNRTGTGDLARASNEAGVPVVVACETFKLAPFEPSEGIGGRRPSADDEEGFDLTPPEAIDRYVTEDGVFAPNEIAALVDQTPFLREGYELLRPA